MFAYITVYGLLGVAVVVWGIMAVRLTRALHAFRMRPVWEVQRDPESLPSVTVCIPARNEVHSLVDCLERVIASTYPKLEIIVLDDHSQDETPNLIRSFASSGVRFVEGKELPDGWLGKNFALDTLVKEASGALVFFMDVDTRIEPNTIDDLVSYMLDQDAAMISVLPRRHDRWRFSIFFSPLRYFWELLFNSKHNPSTSSNAWLVQRSLLTETYQGLSLWKQAIQPETRLAAALSLDNKYQFVISNKQLGVSYEKKWESQVSTSVRLLYPLIGSLPKVILVLIAMIVMMIPVLIIAQALLYGWQMPQNVAFVIGGMFMLTYAAYTFRVWRHGALLGALLWPVLLFQEFVLVIISVERYARGAVTWRGRSIQRQRIKSDALPTPKAD